MNNISIDNLFPNAAKTNHEPMTVRSLYFPVNKQDPGYVDFSVENLIYEQEEKKLKVHNQYKRVFNMCLKKIKASNKLNITEIIFDIPSVVFRCPDYSEYECIKFIEERLNELCLDTLVISKNKLFISWKNVRENKKKTI